MTTRLTRSLISLYEVIVGRPAFAPINTLLYRVALKGLGVWTGVTGESHFARRVLASKESPLILDVGANVGAYASMVKKINPRAVVHAFEPHPLTYARLAVVADRIGFTAHHLGLGEGDSTATIYDYASADGSEHASLYEDVIRKVHHGTPVAHQVDIITLDAFCSRHNIDHVDLLKIDVEGHELSVLKGAKDCLEAGMIEHIQFEFNEMNVVSRVFLNDFINFLPHYKLYRLLPRGYLPLDNRPSFYREIFSAQNIVAFRTEQRGVAHR